MVREINNNKNLPFIEGYYYHIFSQSVGGGENGSEIKHSVFLHCFDQQLSSYFNLYAYCILPDHFHFLVKVKGDAQTSLASLQNLDEVRKLKNSKINKIINQELSKLCYFLDQSISNNPANKNQFRYKIQNELVDKDYNFADSIFHIHYNPAYHNVDQSYQTYPWSSYQYFLNGSNIPIQRNEVLQYFSGKQYFIKFHEEMEQSFKQLSQRE